MKNSFSVVGVELALCRPIRCATKKGAPYSMRPFKSRNAVVQVFGYSGVLWERHLAAIMIALGTLPRSFGTPNTKHETLC
jgi:hypothetical protein